MHRPSSILIAALFLCNCTPQEPHREPAVPLDTFKERREPGSESRFEQPEEPETPKLDPLPQKAKKDIRAWFSAMGPIKPNESFGELITRAARFHLNKPYLNPDQSSGPEILDTTLETFQCVSLVETSLAMARCLWMGTSTPRCYRDEVAATRYRDGRMGGYATRLHYFYDWLENNSQRERLAWMTESMGGKRVFRKFSIMSKNPEKYPALADPLIFAQIQSLEDSLNEYELFWIPTNEVEAMQSQLKEGDIVGVIGNIKGLLISHTGLVAYGQDNQPHYLHASSHHKRVVFTPGTVAEYMKSQKKRKGIVVARPLAP